MDSETFFCTEILWNVKSTVALMCGFLYRYAKYDVLRINPMTTRHYPGTREDPRRIDRHPRNSVFISIGLLDGCDRTLYLRISAGQFLTASANRFAVSGSFRQTSCICVRYVLIVNRMVSDRGRRRNVCRSTRR